jgi:hypothetical protein
MISRIAQRARSPRRRPDGRAPTQTSASRLKAVRELQLRAAKGEASDAALRLLTIRPAVLPSAAAKGPFSSATFHTSNISRTATRCTRPVTTWRWSSPGPTPVAVDAATMHRVR